MFQAKAGLIDFSKLFFYSFSEHSSAFFSCNLAKIATTVAASPRSNFDLSDIKQSNRLAPAYFSPEYEYFDQHLQTVKNETTV